MAEADNPAKAAATWARGSARRSCWGGPRGSAPWPPVRWKTQCNENAKVPAFPPRCRSWTTTRSWAEGRLGPASMPGRAPRPTDEQPQLAAASRCRPISSRRRFRSCARRRHGPRPLARCCLIVLGDFATVTWASRRGVDPTPVRAIEWPQGRARGRSDLRVTDGFPAPADAYAHHTGGWRRPKGGCPRRRSGARFPQLRCRRRCGWRRVSSSAGRVAGGGAGLGSGWGAGDEVEEATGSLQPSCRVASARACPVTRGRCVRGDLAGVPVVVVRPAAYHTLRGATERPRSPALLRARGPARRPAPWSLTAAVGGLEPGVAAGPWSWSPTT